MVAVDLDQISRGADKEQRSRKRGGRAEGGQEGSQEAEGEESEETRDKDQDVRGNAEGDARSCDRVTTLTGRWEYSHVVGKVTGFGANACTMTGFEVRRAAKFEPQPPRPLDKNYDSSTTTYIKQKWTTRIRNYKHLVIFWASFGLEHHLDSLRHAINQLLNIFLWYRPPLVLHPFFTFRSGRTPSNHWVSIHYHGRPGLVNLRG